MPDSEQSSAERSPSERYAPSREQFEEGPVLGVEGRVTWVWDEEDDAPYRLLDIADGGRHRYVLILGDIDGQYVTSHTFHDSDDRFQRIVEPADDTEFPTAPQATLYQLTFAPVSSPTEAWRFTLDRELETVTLEEHQQMGETYGYAEVPEVIESMVDTLGYDII
jgi:hypothetical protein